MKRNREKKPKPPRLDVSMEELSAIVEQTKGALSEGAHEKLSIAIRTLGLLVDELRSKKSSIYRLQQMLFGATTEKTNAVLGDKEKEKQEAKESTEGDDAAKTEKPKCPGHGRRSIAAYTGAEVIKVGHTTLHHGCSCPACQLGRLYLQSEPGKLIRIVGMSPLCATIWELERLRCNLCGKVFTAKAPDGVGDRKYDESATAMVGMMKYAGGVPFHRLEKLQEKMGIPLPAATQWELVRDGADDIEPVFRELIHQAAQGEVLHNDDTTMKVLGLTAELREAAAADSETENRKGIYTTGIISKCKEGNIALFFTGNRHAGENLATVLNKRAAELSVPIQMCDGLAANMSGEFKSILANCNAHARRKFVEVVADFPDECRYVLKTFSSVYKFDAEAKQQKLSADDRLIYHQTHSEPLMVELQDWAERQLDEHLVEPNSQLGDAIRYLLNHWDPLMLFLRKPGAPLDNNICERALKKAILHRKNSLFYQTVNGARVGDIFMSLFYTADLNGVNSFDYLVTLLRRYKEVKEDPKNWMPWNYTATLARMGVS